MKKTVLVLVTAAITAVSSAQAEVSLNVNIGVPAHRVIVSSPPSVRFEVAPLFIASPRLGFYVGVDTPYDIIFSSDFFYLYYGNSWHRSRHHSGPWVEVPYRQLPPGIRNHRIEQIRSYRDREYRVYRKDRDHYRGRYFRPGHERKDERRYEKHERKEDRRYEKHERKDERRYEKHERKDDRREDRKERKEEKRDRNEHSRGRD